MKHIKNILNTSILLLFLISCQPKETQFQIKGVITNASQDTLWLERAELEKNIIVDSVILSEEGSFSFKKAVPEVPEFYNLKLGNKSISLIVDSAQLITIQSDKTNFAKNYSVTGSPASIRVQLFNQLKRQTEIKANRLITLYQNGELNDSLFLTELTLLLDEHKKVTTPSILKEPLSLSSYYALFQKIGNYSIYQPYNKEDYKCFAAVATNLNENYPQSSRAKHLKKYVLEGLALQKKDMLYKTLTNKQEEIGSFDIELPNIHGDTINLYSLKDKVVLLDFTAYETEFSPTRNMALAEIYKEYKEKGFEIYQISLDPNEHFWKTTADNLPWICVYDTQGNNSSYAKKYYVTKIPTYFLINKEGDIVLRMDQVKDLKEEIEKLL